MIPPSLARWAFRSMAVTICAFAALKGVLILATAGDRWHPPTYATALEAPGGHVMWGAAILAFGLAGLVGIAARKPLLAAWSLGLAGAWSVFFALTFVLSALRSPTSSLDPFSTQVLVAVMCLLTAATYRAGRR